MTSRWTIKLALAAASSLVSMAAVAWFLARRPAGVLDTHWLEPLPSASGATPARPSGFRVRPLTPDERERYVPVSAMQDFDDLCHFRYRASGRFEFVWPEHPSGRIVRTTNALGLRGSREVREDRPELRILVVGDSHTDGVCASEETYAAEVERRLAAQGRDVETLNAGVGGYSFHNYVGALERFLPLAPDVVVVGVYGGNDFFDVLALQHLFAGTPIPPGDAEYREQIERATEISEGAVGQALVSLRRFAEFPEELEVALEGARTASAEIADLCEAHGARPVFVYIPPVTDVAWRFHEEILARATEAIGLAQPQLALVDELADRYLAGLRDAGCEVLDLRPSFRAQASSPYWKRDLHINLAGHQLVADALAPRIAALCPPGYARHSREPDVSAVGRVGAAPILGRAWTLEVEDAPLALPELDEARVRALFQLPPSTRFDAEVPFVLDAARVPGVDAGGFRRSGATSGGAGAQRVLLVADELVDLPGDGSGEAGGRLGELVAARAAVECLDATTPGAGPLHHLGFADGLARREVDTLVVAWNGANDFHEALELRRALSDKRKDGEPRAADRKREPLAALSPGEVVERLEQRIRDARPSVEASVEFVFELRRRMQASGARLVVVVVRPNAGMPRSARAAGPDVLDQMATLFAGTLRREGVECLDPDGALEVDVEPVLDATGTRLTAAARGRLADAIATALSAEAR